MNILSLGAGVQSSTLALMAATGEIPPFDHAIFADTQAEPANVMRWLDWLEAEIQLLPYPFPIHRVTTGNLEKDAIIQKVSKRTGNVYIKKLVPAYFDNGKGGKGLLGRICTADYKVKALLKKQKQLGKVPRACKTVMVRTAIGISLDEYQRMKPSREKWCENYWPLIDLKMTRQDCIDWMHAHAFPQPPRSACVFCPFHSDEEWMRLRDQEPEEFARAVAFDENLRTAARQCTGTAKLGGDVFLHTTMVPLSQVKFKDVKSHAQVDMFNNECEGLCGV